MVIKRIPSLRWLLERKADEVVLSRSAIHDLIDLLTGPPPHDFMKQKFVGHFLGREWRWVDPTHLQGRRC